MSWRDRMQQCSAMPKCRSRYCLLALHGSADRSVQENYTWDVDVALSRFTCDRFSAGTKSPNTGSALGCLPAGTGINCWSLTSWDAPVLRGGGGYNNLHVAGRQAVSSPKGSERQSAEFTHITIRWHCVGSMLGQRLSQHWPSTGITSSRGIRLFIHVV